MTVGKALVLTGLAVGGFGFVAANTRAFILGVVLLAVAAVRNWWRYRP
jgi:hypothetical protein